MHCNCCNVLARQTNLHYVLQPALESSKTPALADNDSKAVCANEVNTE